MDPFPLTPILVVVGVIILSFLFRREIGVFIGSARQFSWHGFKIERGKETISEKNQKQKTVQGITSVQAGPGRGEAFLAVRKRARRQIVIMGIGMVDLTHTALESLRAQAANVCIDLLMIDPQYLEQNPEFAVQLAKLFKKEDLAASAQESLATLRALCREWNENRNHLYKFRLRLYSAIPSMTMVMIDPDEAAAEILFESFLPYSGERSRFLLKKSKEPQLFEWFSGDLKELWNHSPDGL